MPVRPPHQAPPIEVVFTAACVRAIRSGHKRQARRVVRMEGEACPFGQTGDRLMIHAPLASVAQNSKPDTILVVVEAVRCERLHTLSSQDLAEEGAGHVFPLADDTDAQAAFATWWDATHPRASTHWADNPIVWVVRFHRAPDAPA